MSEHNGETTHKLHEQEMAFIRRDLDKLDKKVDKLDHSVTEGFSSIAEQMRLMSEGFARQKDMEKEHQRLQDQIDDLRRTKAGKEQFDDVKDNQRKLLVGVVSTVVTAIVGFLITTK